MKTEKPPKYVYSFEDGDGFPDLSQIFVGGLHLRSEFIDTMARFKDRLTPEIKKKGEDHLKICPDCKRIVEETEREYKQPEQLDLEIK